MTLCVLFAVACQAQYTIRTIAGGRSPDNLPATAVAIGTPFGVAVGPDGNLFISSDSRNEVYRLGSDGVIHLIALNPTGSKNENDLTFPNGIAADDKGNVYIASPFNNLVRKIDPDGTITTVAGTGSPTVLNRPVAVAVDRSGNVYITDTQNSIIRRVDSSGVMTKFAGAASSGYSGDNIPAAQASLAFPSGVATDAAGNVYIADSQNHRIRKVDPSGTITTVAGTGGTGYSGDGSPATRAQIGEPTSVAVDGDGNIYFTATGDFPDFRGGLIRKIDGAGTISRIGGGIDQGLSCLGDPGTFAGLGSPTGLAVDASGSLYIADHDNKCVRKIDSAGSISNLAGNGTNSYSGDNANGVDAQMDLPRGIAVDSAGGVYIADTGSSRIRRVDPSGVITTVAGTNIQDYAGDGGPAVSASLSSPEGVAIDKGGNLYIADTLNHSIRRVDGSGTIVTVAGTGRAGSSGDNGLAAAAQLRNPRGIALGESVYIADSGNHRVRKIDSAGNITTVAGTGVSGFSGDKGPARDAQLNSPGAVAVDPAGNLYIGDSGNNRVRKVDPAGIITTVAGTGAFGFSGDNASALDARLSVSAVAVDGLGNLFIADRSNYRIRTVNAAGIITTIAGNGESGYSGDDGLAGDAALGSPAAIAVDANGDIFIADGDRIRELVPLASQ